MVKKKIGKYTLMRQLATGGMAEIWLAEQRGPGGFNKELVIKRILPHLAEEGEMTQMFFDEARIVAHLTHPNIGQVFELGEDDGDYFIAMEFIDGLDLVDVRVQIKERDMTLPVSYAARIICDVLQALDHAHNFVDRDGNHVGLIHRDISPHNVLISKDGVSKLVDFGVAKAAMNTHKTETGAVKGKFAYMAPEQIENDDLDHRVDIFAVGAVFFELLTGEKPFGDDLKAVSRIISEDAPDPRDLRPEIPDRVAQIILKALSRNREERYDTAAEMDRDLEDYLKKLDSVVGTRELAVMVHQLRGLKMQKPTEQLFGFQKQGVERQGPRITVNEAESPNTAQASKEAAANNEGSQAVATATREQETSTSTETSSDSAVDSAKPAEVSQTSRETPSVKAGRLKREDVEGGEDLADVEEMENTEGFGDAELDEPLPSRMVSEPKVRLEVAIGFVVAMFVLIATFVGGTHLILSSVDEAGAAAVESSLWRHGEDALVVFIDTDEPADLYFEDEQVGKTPFHTTLRPGSYDLELRTSDGSRQEVEITVEEDKAIQNYRFEL